MARTPRLGKTERLSANDEYGNKPTSYYLKNNAYQEDGAFATVSTVNAFATVRALNGQRNYKNQLAKGRYNIKRKTKTYTGQDVTTINIYNEVNL